MPKERQFHYDAMGAGHYGIFSGRRWREQVYPEVREFIARFGTGPLPKSPKAAKTARKAPAKKAKARTR